MTGLKVSHHRTRLAYPSFLGNEALLRAAAGNPSLGMDGTINIIAPQEGVHLEVNSFMAKDPVTGNKLCAMWQKCSRKTLASHRVLMMEFIKRLVAAGLEVPMRAPPNRRSTVGTDFDTTYVAALGHACTEQFQSGQPLTYAQKSGFGCDVNAQKAVREKVDVVCDAGLLKWALGSRNLGTDEEVCSALKAMETMSEK